MIHYFKFKNFYSFKDEAVIDFRVSKKDARDDSVSLSPAGEYISKLMVVLGANASGKTNAIKPLAFLKYFICKSYSSIKPGEEIPLEPHALAKEQATEFEIQFEHNNEVYRYQLHLNRERVLEENFFVKATTQFSFVFRRAWDEKKEIYIWDAKPFFGLSKRQVSLLRPNASLIAIALHAGSKLAFEIVSKFETIATNVFESGRYYTNYSDINVAAILYHDDDLFLKKMELFLQDCDFGINKINVKKMPYKNEEGKVEHFYNPVAIHGKGKSSFQLDMASESSGTKGAFVLLASIFPVLENGGVAVVDELESDLHPHLISKIVGLFTNLDSNPHGAQLLFTCHALEILNHLSKAQITLVEKSSLLESTLWRLDDIEGVRADENYLAKYTSGAYGAVPRI